MWHREYKDYEIDKPLIHYQVSPGNGIIGCEMHDLNGWGTTIHVPVKRKRKGILSSLITLVFGTGKKRD